MELDTSREEQVRQWTLPDSRLRWYAYDGFSNKVVKDLCELVGEPVEALKYGTKHPVSRPIETMLLHFDSLIPYFTCAMVEIVCGWNGLKERAVRKECGY